MTSMQTMPVGDRCDNAQPSRDQLDQFVVDDIELLAKVLKVRHGIRHGF